MGWWGDNVPEETLSRDEATRVVRRLLRMLQPWRALIVVAVLVLMAQAATLLAGPLLVKHGIDAGLPSAHNPSGDAGSLDLTVIVYLVVAFAGLVLGRIAIVLVARVGEGFLRDLRNRLFGHMMSLSLDYFETEKTGKIVARMTSDIDAMEELVSQGLVLFVQNTFVFVGAVTVVLIVSWQLAVGILVIVPPVYFGQPLVPPRLEQGVPRGARHDLDQPQHAAGEPRGSAGRPGVRPRRRVHPQVPPDERRPVPREHAHRSHLVEVLPDHRVRGCGGHGGHHRLRRLADHTRDRHRRHRRRVRVVAQQPVRADQPAEPALQHRAVVGGGA